MTQQQKAIQRVLSRLFEQGYNTEKTITDLSLEQMLAIPQITMSELGLITGLQKAIREKKVISFISNAEE